MKWPRTFADRLGLDLPIIQAPMAGGPATPELAAAVSNAGGLGSFAGAGLAPEVIREAIRKLRTLTSRPFCVNLFAPERVEEPRREAVDRAAAALAPYRAEVGLGPASPSLPPAFDAQLRVVLEERVAAFSFTFGALAAEDVAALARSGATVIGTATTVREARALEASGVHAVIAQGGEAGGHRGTFLGAAEGGLTGTLALVPQIADAVPLPVVAAGGIMDGRGIAAALALGAQGVQLGTAFLSCPEAGTSQPYRDALLVRRDDDPTGLTRAFSGRLARGLRNRFMDEMTGAPILPFPFQNGLTGDLRRAAAKLGKADLLSLWAGQGVGLARVRPAGALVRELAKETEEALARLG